MNPIDEFLMEKEGAAPQRLARQAVSAAAPEAGSSALKHLGRGLAWGAGAVGTALMGQAALEAYEAAKGAIQKSRGFNSMLEGNPGLRKMDRQKVQSIYSTLHRFNPEMAQDPFVAGSMVKKINEYDYVDPRTIGELVSARNRMSRGPLFDPVSLSTGMADVAMRSYEGEQRQAHDWKRLQAEQDFRSQQSLQEQQFRQQERGAGEQFTMQRDDLSHQRRMDEQELSSRFNWRRDQEKLHREDERMREKAWAEAHYRHQASGTPTDQQSPEPIWSEMAARQIGSFGGPRPFPKKF